MANRAVLGAAALGIAYYNLNEHLKERRVRLEREENEQLFRDRAEERERQRQQKEQQSGGDDGNGGVDAFDRSVLRLVRSLLLERVIQRVRDRAALAEKMEPLRAAGNSLSLPLLIDSGSNNNRICEVVLGAALALSCPGLVEEALLSGAVCGLDAAGMDKVTLPLSPPPGLALAKLSKNSVRLICRAFRDEKQEAPYGFALYQDLLPFVRACLLNERFQSQRPALESVTISSTRAGMKGQRRLARHLMLHLIPARAYKINSSKKVVRIEPSILQHKLQYKLNCLKGALPDLVSGEEAFLTNFLGDFSIVGECGSDSSSGEFTYSFETLEALKKIKRSHISPPPDQYHVLSAQAGLMASKIAKVASDRLKKLSSNASGSGLSLEHINVACGYEGNTLQNLADSDQRMIEAGGHQIADKITDLLLRCVPSPDEQHVAAVGGEATEELRQEVAAFVVRYVMLLNFAYCEIPRLRGHPPSAFVTGQCVYIEGLSDAFSLLGSNVHGIHRILENEERRRLIRARSLSSPSYAFTASFLVLLWLVSSWLSFASLKSTIFTRWADNAFRFWTIAISCCLGLALARSMLLLLVDPLRVDKTQPYNLQAWSVGAAIVEYTARKWAIRRGRPVPFDVKIWELKDYCQKQHRVWKMRIAKREYFEALRRKKISYRNSVLLLSALSNESSSAETVHGTLPGRLEDAEAFLHLEVEHENDSETKLSGLEAFLSLSSDLERDLRFNIGDRVILVPNSEKETEQLDVPDSTATALTELECRKGSVMMVLHDLNHVIFDGHDTPQMVPASMCQKLKENDNLFGHKLNETVEKSLELSQTLRLSSDSYEDNKGDPSGIVNMSNDDKSVKRSDTLQFLDAIHEGGHHVDAVSDKKKSMLRPDTVQFLDGNHEGNQDDLTDADSSPAASSRFMRTAQKARTIEEALAVGGWRFSRGKNHIVYTRQIRIDDGETRKQSFSMAKTPSNHRSAKNALSTLNRLNEHDRPVESEEDAAGAGGLICYKCCRLLPEHAFSKTQRKKNTPKCGECAAKAQ